MSQSVLSVCHTIYFISFEQLGPGLREQLGPGLREDCTRASCHSPFCLFVTQYTLFPLNNWGQALGNNWGQALGRTVRELQVTVRFVCLSHNILYFL